MAIEHNPNISVARLIALAQAQVTREVRSAELPTATGDLTAVGAHENSRITAGLLTIHPFYDRAAGGLTVSQLITDFGRTQTWCAARNRTRRRNWKTSGPRSSTSR